MPLISINWKDQFRWRGNGKITDEELTDLNELVFKIHLENKIIRFWGVPDNKLSWEVLFNSGVDLINTDKVTQLYEFISKKNQL